MPGRYRYSQLLPILNIVVDSVLLNIAFLLVYYTKFGLREDLIMDEAYMGLLVAFNALWLAFSITKYPYEKSRISFNLPTLLVQYFQVVILHAGFIAILWVLIKGFHYSRYHIAGTYFVFAFLGTTWRFSSLIFLKWYRAAGYNTRKYSIVGYGKLAPTIVHYFNSYPEMGYQFSGYYDTTPSRHINGDLDDLKIMIARYEIDTLYCCLPYLHHHHLKDIIEFAQNYSCEVKIFFDYRSFVNKEVNVEYHGFVPVISLSDKPFRDLKASLIKRTFDIIFSLTSLLLLAPLLFLIALITKFTSPGPIFFNQERIGQFGKSFTIYKFRSMYSRSEATPIPSQGALDPRITHWGHFMRKTRLDELPQFFNVLKGDMSIVGPRPLTVFDVEGIMEVAPEYRFLLTMRPGITSFGQVSYGHARNVEESVARLLYDLEYLKKNSFTEDIRIMVKTLQVMVKANGR
ncbi:exopolysaccharide biosynthesis polyprenyl glycosylphosphotransferase [Telluribacter sp.]|jgi:putative colanic acid biosynthesis UDP-glucose lipid carrier transferase|uniref:exopolysaccharide biosynthesis polyprenyl glycosylphosphotransferase n=1 Tax=Telluribacter sp. TaxID=1978767 RepID=UPI002E0E6B7F|nr:exopolysaccharide biosynthesis polyprenyl glycosylphosphotransferase [Telluribacter sp.]